MPRTTEATLDVRAPIAAVFARWTRFEAWPSFMEGVEDVRRLDERHLRLWGRVAGAPRDWVVALTQMSPGASLGWSGLDGPPAAARVMLDPLPGDRTRMSLRLDDDDHAPAGDDLERRAARTLGRLRDLLERGVAAGAGEDDALPPVARYEGLGIVAALRDLAVADPSGERVGGVVDAYLDLGAMRVRYLAVATGALDPRPHLVPVEAVSWDPVWRSLTLPYTREQLRDAPTAPARGELRPADEEAASDYFRRIHWWDARRDAIERRQTPPSITPEIARLDGRTANAVPAPTREIAEAAIDSPPPSAPGDARA